LFREWVTVRYQLKHGDVLSLAVEDKDEDVSPYIIPADLPLEVVYEDEYVTAINKPYNMPAHPSLGHQLDTAANALAHRYRDRVYVFRPVNRLDRDTSGCMLTSNTRDASYKMYLAMTNGEIRKSYIAVLDGIPPADEGVLESYMHRKPDSIIMREETSPDAPDAKPAVTTYRVLAKTETHSIVLASPITGRTHQIRVQFAGVGCPVTGDTLYGAESPHIVRHALHSWKTEFPHPMTGERITVTAPVPEDMRSLMNALGFPDFEE
jgi:23S rRNA pseudouridine1911/1915/1917 synthase